MVGDRLDTDILFGQRSGPERPTHPTGRSHDADPRPYLLASRAPAPFFAAPERSRSGPERSCSGSEACGGTRPLGSGRPKEGASRPCFATARQNNGLQSCLTLSGVTTETKLLSEENKIKPDFYVGSIAEFM